MQSLLAIADQNVNPFESEAFIHYVINVIPYGVCWIDRQSIYRGCNRVFAESHGCTTPEELVGKSIFDMRIPEALAETIYLRNLQVMEKGEAIIDLEEVFMTETGIKTFLSSKFPVRDASGHVTGMIVSFNDITEIKRTQVELELAKKVAEMALADLKKSEEVLRINQASLLHSSKMASLGMMASGLAHEINNPLAIIKGNADSLALSSELGEGSSSESVLRQAKVISQTVDRLAKIVYGLKVFSRDSNVLERQHTEPKTVVSDTLAFCESKFKSRSIRFSADIQGKLPLISVNAVQISQVLINLLNNAHDAVAHESDRWVALRVENTEEGVLFSVENSGPRISASVIERFAEAFFTTKPVGSGTGLGLSISKDIIQNHRGRLFVGPNPDHTQICFCLPRGE